MQNPGRVQSKAEVQKQRAKLVNSYQELLTEFSNPELRTVGNYQIGKLIGKGSFGKVYLATHKLTNGSKVVLKSAKKDDANLAREIHHHRQLVHPHITRLYEVIVTETLVWLVLEYCPGDELYDYLIKHGKLTVPKAKKIFTQLVGAVAYVHLNNCVHRDLKLENIMLDKNEDVKLCDFGFTREYERNKLLQTFCGTVCYSAPEMLKGERYMAHAVDVWSLGVILYALLCGELPFDEDDENDTKMKILHGDPKWPDSLPEDAASLIKAMLAKKPSQRPTLDDLLSHPFLAEHAGTQKAILAATRAPAFSTRIEKDCLHRMKAAGVDIDQVIENVLAHKCDALCGWWALLIQKEERKERRRQKRKQESRRQSAASNLEALFPPPVEEVEEEGGNAGKNAENNPIIILPGTRLTASPQQQSPDSSSNHRSPPPLPNDRDYGPYLKPPQSSSDRQVRSTPDLRGQAQAQAAAEDRERAAQNAKNRPNRKQALMMQLASIKHWFLDTTKRATSPQAKHPGPPSRRNNKPSSLYQQHIHPPPSSRSSISSVRRSRAPSKIHYIDTNRRTPPPYNRNSLSPQPLTPRSNYKRRSSSRTLGGRNSTSSSVSSIRSFHKQSHSKASSTSSASISSVTITPRSPHASLKMLHPPAPHTPVVGSSSAQPHDAPETPFPSYFRFRQGGYNESAIPSSGPIAFAKRKRSVFKGPSNSNGKRDSQGSLGRKSGRRSGNGIIEEEEEDEEEQMVGEVGALGASAVLTETEGEGMTSSEDEDGFVDETGFVEELREGLRLIEQGGMNGSQVELERPMTH